MEESGSRVCWLLALCSPYCVVVHEANAQKVFLVVKNATDYGKCNILFGKISVISIRCGLPLLCDQLVHYGAIECEM